MMEIKQMEICRKCESIILTSFQRNLIKPSIIDLLEQESDGNLVDFEPQYDEEEEEYEEQK